MVVGVIKLSLILPGCRSLKEKRPYVRRLISRLKNEFSVSAAEVGNNDLWQSATVGVVFVGNDAQHVNSVLDKVVSFTESFAPVELADVEMEIVHY